MSESYRPPSRFHRFAVWLLGFVLTGRVFHGVSREDVSRLRPGELLVHGGSMCILLASAAYVLFVVPDVLFSNVLSVGAAVALMLGGLPILAQWGVTKGLELRE